ncbi:MAG: hypothetical protein JO327_01970 [Nitrososphaeraceae archaeon]|nr:hypothetical protein [Nitrososphaeraceae archaeon]MBV9666877.1 hypothetical protein [Nitrososphaeraceae archaeon]
MINIVNLIVIDNCCHVKIAGIIIVNMWTKNQLYIKREQKYQQQQSQFNVFGYTLNSICAIRLFNTKTKIAKVASLQSLSFHAPILISWDSIWDHHP